jgi:ribosomal protein L21E
MTNNKVHSETNVGVQVLSCHVKVTEKLTEQEGEDRHRLELKIEKSFYEAGKALAELRNRRLYKSTHKNFEDYCRDRFQFSRDKADMMIKSVEIIDNLKKDDNCRLFLPTAESQVRDMVNLTSIEQCQVYAAAIKECGGKVPSRRVIKNILKQSKALNLTSLKNFYSEGDIVKICANDNINLRKYDCYWGIIIKNNTTSCIVHINVKQVDVKCNFTEVEKVELKYITDIKSVDKRISNLMQKSNDLSSIAISLLEMLGRRLCFSSDDLWFLRKLEERYGEYPRSVSILDNPSDYTLHEYNLS